MTPNRYIVTVTMLRKHLAQYIARVRYGDEWVCIQRRGCDPVYLVSQVDFNLICKERDELMHGPTDPETGKRPAKGFWYQLCDVLAAERKGN